MRRLALIAAATALPAAVTAAMLTVDTLGPVADVPRAVANGDDSIGIGYAAHCLNPGYQWTYTIFANPARGLDWSVNGRPMQPDSQPFVFAGVAPGSQQVVPMQFDAVWSDGQTAVNFGFGHRPAAIDGPYGPYSCSDSGTTTTLPATTTTAPTTTEVPTSTTATSSTTSTTTSTTSSSQPAPSSTTSAPTTTPPTSTGSSTTTPTTSTPPSTTTPTTGPTTPPPTTSGPTTSVPSATTTSTPLPTTTVASTSTPPSAPSTSPAQTPTSGPPPSPTTSTAANPGIIPATR